MDQRTLPTQAERNKGFRRTVRMSYRHTLCAAVTTIDRAHAETYARDPLCFTSTYCAGCQGHFPMHQFTWEDDGTRVGT